MTVEDRQVAYRAYEGIVYVANPVDAPCQSLNFYVPAAYYEGRSVGGYTAETAPIFLPNSVGGYIPGKPGKPKSSGGLRGPGRPAGPEAPTPGADRQNAPNAIAVALSKGLVVAAPGARGRTLKDEKEHYIGKAAAAIVDLKAAVRYLRHNDKLMPGNTEKIISNGTSAGGALSALLGATGNNADFDDDLKATGAAEGRDDIFGASCYCPITNLDHADATYEWLFNGVSPYQGRGGSGT